MNELPSGWVQVNLSDIAYIESGIGFPPNYQGEKAGDLGFFKVGDISRAVAQFNGQLKNAQHYVSFSIASELKGKPILAGATVFAKIGEAIRLHRRAYVVEDCLIDNNVMAVKAFDSRFDRYLFRFMQSQDISELARSTTVPSLRKGDIEGLYVPLAPLAEQKRIADKLDAVLARVDACRNRLDRIPDILKRFRQSVLAAATSGKLTEDLRGGDISNWTHERAADVCAKVQSGGTPKEGFTHDGIPFLKIYNIVNQKVAFDYKPQYIAPAIHQGTMSKSKVQPGDVLMNIVGPPLGKVAIVPDSNPGWNINQAITLFRPSDRISTGWLYCILCGGENIAEIVHETRGSAGQTNISLSQCRDFIFPVPSVEEQTEIVRRVETLLAYADRLEARYNSVRAQVEKLTPATLAKAFRGELVPQDPNDEPASKLLERILLK